VFSLRYGISCDVLSVVAFVYSLSVDEIGKFERKTGGISMKMRSFRLKAPVFFSQVLHEPLELASRGELSGQCETAFCAFALSHVDRNEKSPASGVMRGLIVGLLAAGV
jgi:hypothetical protein